MEDGPVTILVSRVVPQSHLNATDRIYGEPVKENKVEVKDNIHDHLDDNLVSRLISRQVGGRQYSVFNISVGTLLSHFCC